MIYKKWQIFGRVSEEQIDQLNYANIKTYVEPVDPITIKIIDRTIFVPLYLPQVCVYTETEQQETILFLVIENKNLKFLGCTYEPV